MSTEATVRGFSAVRPRSVDERKRDVLDLLGRERHVWLATSGTRGAHLVPLGCAWDGRRLIMATHQGNLTVRNLVLQPLARAALGSVTDVVLIDGDVTVLEPSQAAQLDGAALDALPMDPRRGGDRVFLILSPVRILTWRHRGELADRTVMAKGQWLA
jgi:hypothetical protein